MLKRFFGFILLVVVCLTLGVPHLHHIELSADPSTHALCALHSAISVHTSTLWVAPSDPVVDYLKPSLESIPKSVDAYSPHTRAPPA